MRARQSSTNRSEVNAPAANAASISAMLALERSKVVALERVATLRTAAAIKKRTAGAIMLIILDDSVGELLSWKLRNGRGRLAMVERLKGRGELEQRRFAVGHTDRKSV